MVDHAADAAEGQVLTCNQATEVKDAGRQRAAAVVGTYASDAHRSWVHRQCAGCEIDQIALLGRVEPRQADAVGSCIACAQGRSAIGQSTQQIASRRSAAVAHGAVACVGCAVVGFAEVVGTHGERRHKAAQQRHGQPVVHDPSVGQIPCWVANLIGAGCAGEVGLRSQLLGAHTYAGVACGCGHAGAVDIPKAAYVCCAGAANQSTPTCTCAAEQTCGIAIGNHPCGAHAHQAASTRIAFHAARCVGIGDIAGSDSAH